ncbi:hypothetical protein PROFUN_02136 [Planoprotostelium fungivorum]|uniref:ER membrane protein complex subunit 7 beta-sandwich domain-containing protein n=1 Tax=Planoprotostelium fungivorum TaxID=1890364 RepID=A0A2P6NZ82_9EUKA|nr:hypothetical protein PROFUN_02136 [Planoprotostelium fungivorum]
MRFCLVLLAILSIVTAEPSEIGSNDVTLRLRGQKGTYSTLCRKDGSFAISDVAPGAYLFEVSSTDLIYPQLRVEVSGKGQMRISRGEDNTQTIPHPLRITAEGRADYFTPREGFEVMSLLKNPMMLMMGVTLGMTWVVPKIMGSLDEEALEELQGGANRQQLEEPPTWEPPTLRPTITNH